MPLTRRDRPPAASRGGMCAGRPKYAPHPVHRNRREPSTSPCHSRYSTDPACHGLRRGVCLAAQLFAAPDTQL